MTGTLANAQLTQRKLVTGTSPDLSFWTQESIALGIGSLANPFKVLVAGSAETMTVAEYVDVDPFTPLWTVNPLTGFSRGSTFLGTVVAGDVLELTAPPEEWGLGTGVVSYHEVASVDGSGNLVVYTPFWTRSSSMNWQVRHLGVVVASGTGTGVLQRLNPASGTYLDNQFQSLFFTPTEALNHMAYTTTMLDSLRNAIIVASNEYAQAPNPITSNFTA